MKASNYREVKGAPYTRKEYSRGVPPPRITKFTMGNPSGNFEHRLLLVSEKKAQIRHNALEAARVATNRYLQRKLGTSNYFLRILPYPHVILRENKMLFKVHADRFQDGMRKAFGKPVGTAARVGSNQPVIMVYVNKDGVEVAKEALRRGAAKLPNTYRIIVEEVGFEGSIRR
ncbi:50S ribosomal protein L16 [Candidatus Bathyarchaeota archaeon]|nr:MAG: 50S ribosomal protein L16 [Candidatus Bathyarchaeota archaeon]RLG98595.1 MAG: 50S ribosomal protein L16 [Candidatus Bathyarchaeota archaeon]